MRERGEEGRPIATHHASAFLAPVGGVVPAPSSMLDEEGSPSEPSVNPQMRGRLRLITLVTSIAVWAVLSALFRYYLAATEPILDLHPRSLGEDVTHWMHAGWSWYLANAALVATGVVLAVRRLPGRTRHDWLLIGAASATGAVLLSLVIAFAGGYSAAVVAGVAIVWLVALYLARRRLSQA